MRGNPIISLLIFSIIILAIDFYVFWGIRKITRDYRALVKKIVTIAFWFVPVFSISGLVMIFLFRESISPAKTMTWFYYVSGPFILFYVPKLIFILFNLVDDIYFLIRKLVTQVQTKSNAEKRTITRRKFLTQVGIVTAGIPFLSLFYGIVYGRFDFTVRKLKLKFKSFPKEMNGLKVVQISDFHIGSFLGKKKTIDEAVDLINQQHADILLFTGDFVNNVSTEVDEFIESLKNLKARIGKFSVLGNHDYGEYVRWPSVEEKKKNLNRLIKIQQDIGFDLLLNESRTIELNGANFELLGVENWGLPPFPQYGDLEKTLSGSNSESFQILMSHDPTHFSAQVAGKTNIDLTLSGHTHGAQFGIEIPGWRWSPVNLRYKYWGGLYEEANQKIYVNTGIGFIGFPGRVGMPPEITVFEIEQG
ncbi:MAG: metallophosphoesterase [Calditrichaeota bacterium]|nr:MAG: metallophosphoesterase [Calditrichota bacterium]MBL1207345.1 metallophosphoesterase [Calditrichota bacterium]NOG47178.1 metallophosphoesterase [Calditrichota bacterium]